VRAPPRTRTNCGVRPIAGPRRRREVLTVSKRLESDMILAADYPFLNIFWTMILFFSWVIWIWMLVVILTDVFRRRDISGWAKAAWTVFLIVLPFIGVLTYLIVQGEGMNARRIEESQVAKSQFDDYVKTVAAQDAPAAQIERAKGLLDSGTITAVEFESLKAKALA
jgi:Phospholipase_D-nuclease N-terminal